MLHSKKDVGSIQVFTHGFKVMAHDPRIKLACRRVLSDWVVRTDKKVENARGEMVTVSVPTQIYGAELNNGESFWFHKGQFPGLQTELRANQLMAEDLRVEYIKTHKPDKVKLELRKGRVLRDYQEDARRFALDDVDVGDHFSKLIAIPTGGGKTVSLCGIMEELGERVMISVLPKYHVKWVGDKEVTGDLESNLDIKKSDIMPVENKGQLRGLIHICKEQGSKKLPKIIAITLTTLSTFIDDYEADPEGCLQDYGAVPWQLPALTGIGLVGVDEAHEHIYKVFKLAAHLHGVKFIALSGTMRAEDAFVERVQNVIFPKIKRYEEVKMEKYIDVEFIGYHFARDLLHKIRYQAFGRNDYSHAVLEKSILRYPRLLNGYIKIVTGILDWDFVKVRRPEEKAIVYVATVDMADKFITALTVRYPHLKIARYCAAQGDKYADLMSSDITVSTIQSSGTAVDIPNLICNICTTMVNSSKSNLQVLGRLRKLPGGRKVTLYMPFCRDIKKHFKYTEFRFELFKDITKSIKTFNYGNRVGDDF